MICFFEKTTNIYSDSKFTFEKPLTLMDIANCICLHNLNKVHDANTIVVPESKFEILQAMFKCSKFEKLNLRIGSDLDKNTIVISFTNC